MYFQPYNHKVYRKMRPLLADLKWKGNNIEQHKESKSEKPMSSQRKYQV